MEIFRRLTIILALFTLIGLLGTSGYFYYNHKLEHKMVHKSYEIFENAEIKCERNSSSADCWLADEMRKSISEHADKRNNNRHIAKNYLIAALGLPVLILLIYFSYGWIVYGKVPNLRSK